MRITVPGLLATVILLFVFGTLRHADGAACTAGQSYGVRHLIAPADYLVPDPAQTGRSYKTDKIGYKINCCGLLTKWTFYAASKDVPVELRIYRYNTVSSNYEVVGSKTYTPSPIEKDTEVNAPLASAEYVTVMPDDYIGWYSSGQDVIGIANNTVAGGLITTGAGPHTWSSVSTNMDGAPTIAVHLDPNVSPSFGNLPASYSASGSSISAGTVCGMISSSDADDTVLTVTMQASTAATSFDLDTSVDPALVKYKGTTAAGSYELTFEVSDPCGNTATAKMTCVVANDPPVITNAPDSKSLTEDVTLAESLMQLAVTEPDSETYTCRIDPCSEVACPFSLRPVVGVYSLWLDDNPNLNAATVSSYTISMVCQDASGADSAPYSYVVTITPNQPPAWDDTAFPAGHSVTISALTTTSGSAVFTAVATDADSSDLTYNITCAVATCPFQTTTAGVITATRDISLEKVTSYDVDVYVSDDSGNQIGPRTLTVNIDDVNYIPVFATPSDAISITEDQATGSVLYTATATDANPTDKLTYTISSNPSAGDDFFEIVCTCCNCKNPAARGRVKLKSTADINYETLNQYVYDLTITATDSKEVSETFTLKVTITNVNEPPAFGKNSYAIEIPEARNVGDAAISTPTWTVTENDIGDTLKYSLNTGCAYFNYLTMNENTGYTHWNALYNIDNPPQLARTANCQLTVTDAAGETDTTTLQFSITDINDETPFFDQTSYTYTTTTTLSKGDNVGTVTANDFDIDSPNKDITFSADGSCGVKADGTVYSDVTVTDPTTLTCTVYAKDGGDPQLTASVPVTILVTDPTTGGGNANTNAAATTTTTQKTYNYSTGNDGDLVWIILLAIAGLALLTALLCILARYCRKCRCKRTPKRAVTPEKRPPTPPSPPPTPPPSKVIKDPDDGPLQPFWGDHNFQTAEGMYR